MPRKAGSWSTSKKLVANAAYGWPGPMSTVTLASISHGSGPGFGVASEKTTAVSSGAFGGKVPVTTISGSTVPVVRLNWSSDIRQPREPSWTVAGGRGGNAGLTNMNAMMKAASV